MPPTVKISTLSGFRIRERYVRGSDDGFTEQQAAKVQLLKELTAASTAGNHVALRRLLKQPSADANYRPRGPTGPALLHLAAASGDDRSCELLCIHGARVNAKYGVHGNTALHDAARADHAAACAALIRCHADTSAKNNVVSLAVAWHRRRGVAVRIVAVANPLPSPRVGPRCTGHRRARRRSRPKRCYEAAQSRRWTRQTAALQSTWRVAQWSSPTSCDRGSTSPAPTRLG